MIGRETRMLLRHYLEQGASKSALARQLGVSRDTIHRWVRDGELDRDLDTTPVRYGPRRPVPTKLAAPHCLENNGKAGKCPGLGTGRLAMKAIVVTDQAAGTAGMTLVERPEPQAAINDVVVQVHASGFVPTELGWPSTWADRLDRDRTPSIPGHELAGIVTALGYGTSGLSMGQRVFGLTDWYRDGTLAEYAAVEARNLAPLPGDVDFTVGASLPISGLTAWQGLFEHGRLQAGQSVLVHGAAGAVGSMVTQLAREAGAYVIGTGRGADRQTVLDFGAQEFVDLENDVLEEVGEVELVFDVIGGDIGKRSAGLIRAGGALVSIVGPPEARPADGLAVDFVVESDRARLSEIVRRVRDGRLRTNIGHVSTLDDAVAAFNRTERRKGKTIIRVRP
jgi:NADPH:quinone reductase-like Zn-dependent oxidoreductase